MIVPVQYVDGAVGSQFPRELHRGPCETLGSAPRGEPEYGAVVVEDATEVTDPIDAELSTARDGPACVGRQRAERRREKGMRLGNASPSVASSVAEDRHHGVVNGPRRVEHERASPPRTRHPGGCAQSTATRSPSTLKVATGSLRTSASPSTLNVVTRVTVIDTRPMPGL